MSRSSRKGEHVHHALSSGNSSADFNDCSLVHQSISHTDYEDINLATSLAGIPLNLPVFINAMTGGTADTKIINKNLASAARDAGMALAVGSQMSALEDKHMRETFQVVREEYPEGIIFANIGAYASPEMAMEAVDMLKAAALQVHLNIPQELIMAEGDRNYKGYLNNIRSMVKSLDVPVIVKEVGFGMSRETAEKILNCGVKVLDIGGYGGSNFIRIEAQRRNIILEEEMMNWGIPTLISLLEALEAARGKGEVVASGGINSAFKMAKSLALGASAVGMAGLPLSIIQEKGKVEFLRWARDLTSSLKQIMVMVGASSINELRTVPLVIRGKTAEWLDKRGIDTCYLAQR